MEEPNLYAKYVLDYRKLVEFFRGDANIEVKPLNDATHSCEIVVHGTDKYNALQKHLRITDPAGGTNSLHVTLALATPTDFDEVKALFYGNPHVDEIYMRGEEGEGVHAGQCMFKKEVIQYDADNIGHPHKKNSTLMENLAKEILADTHVFYATTEEN